MYFNGVFFMTFNNVILCLSIGMMSFGVAGELCASNYVNPHEQQQTERQKILSRFENGEADLGEKIYWWAKDNDLEALDCLRKCAENNNETAIYYMLRLASENNKNALHHAIKLADNGVVYAQYKLGLMYIRGAGVEQNDEKGYQYIKLAADQGNAQSQFELAMMYTFGIYVTKDKEQAAYWCKIAADKDYEPAKVRLGFIHCYGKPEGTFGPTQ